MSNGRIPDEIIQAILRAHDIADIVGRYVQLTKQGQYMKGLCPFHSEKSPSFTVTPEKQIYHCFGCGAGGNLIRFVQEVEGISFGEAVRKLAAEAHISIGESALAGMPETQEQKDRQKLLEAYEWAGKLYQYILMNTEQGKPARAYLHKRGLNDRLIETFGIGYAYAHWSKLAELLEKRGFPMPLMEQGGLVSARQDGSGYYDKFRDRIIFPIHNAQGQLIAFAGRALGESNAKYLNSPESVLFHKSRTLYNLNRARAQIRKTRELVLMEGYMDVIKAWEAGVENVVATMGTALTPEHAGVIRNLAERVVIVYDGDNAGQTAAYKSIPILEKAGLQVRVAVLTGGKDPDEFITAYGSERFVREAIHAAVPSIKYKLIYFRKDYRLQEDGEKLRYIQQALRLIAGLPLPIEREHYVRELSSEFNYAFETAMQTMNEFRLKAEKNAKPGDNLTDSWNNVMNDGRARKRTPSLFPAYHNAERQLLAAMMTDRDLSLYVERQLGDQFNVEAHAALAAHLYGYYAQGLEPGAGAFIGTLQDEELESLASSLLLSDFGQAMNSQAIDDCIREIKKVPLQRAIENKREEMISAERSGDIRRAALIGSEIISLEKQLKTS